MPDDRRRESGFSITEIRASRLVLLLAIACEPVDQPSRTDLPRAPKNHRAERRTCVANATHAEPRLPSSPVTLACTQNADCARGWCETIGSSTKCVQDTCITNTDCAGVAICECGAANLCVAGGCLDDRDCGSGGYCSPSGCETTSATPHYCHTTDDQCFDDADCTGVDRCRYQASSRTWRCVTASCP